MGLAWIQAGFSKDPNTQVGAVIVDSNNVPLGYGYNGLPRIIQDTHINWDRNLRDKDALNKYDLVIHAEANALDHTFGVDLSQATIYVTALPCPDCMLRIVSRNMRKVVYFDYQSTKNSSLQNAAWRDKSLLIAKAAPGLNVEKFTGNINWLLDWTVHMNQIGVFDRN